MKIYRLLLGLLLHVYFYLAECVPGFYWRKVLAGMCLWLCCLNAFGQTHTFPALDTQNNFTGSNTFITLNNCREVDQYPGADLSAKLLAAKAAGGGCMKLTANGSYTMQTTVSTLNAGDFIDCQNSTIDASTNISSTPLMVWSGDGSQVAGTGSVFTPPPTGIQHCYFKGNGGGTSGFAITDKRIGHFTAYDIGCFQIGCVDLQDEAVLSHIEDVHAYQPTFTPVFRTTIVSGAFGPNGTIFDHDECEQIPPGFSITCFEIDAGGIESRNTYIETAPIGYRLNGATASLSLSGGSINFRLNNGVGLQIDNTNPSKESLIGDNFTFAYGVQATDPGKTNVGILNNLAGTHLNITGAHFFNFSDSSATTTFIKTTADMFFTMVGTKLHANGTSGTTTIFDPNGASGVVDLGSISGNSFFGEAGGTFNWTASGSVGSFNNQTITANQMLRVLNIVRLGSGVTFVANQINNGPVLSFNGTGTGTNSLIGLNGFGGVPTLTLNGAACFLQNNVANNTCNTNLQNNGLSGVSSLSITEGSVPAGASGVSLIAANSSDHFLTYNPNNAGVQHIAQAVSISTNYTNATTTFSTVTGMSWTIAASNNYVLDCTFVGQGSVTTAGPKFQLTGPASPTLVKLMVDGGTGAAAYADGVATGFSSANTILGTLGAGTTDFIWHVNASIVNGGTAGTVVLQAAANGAGTLTISGGSCQIQ